MLFVIFILLINGVRCKLSPPAPMSLRSSTRCYQRLGLIGTGIHANVFAARPSGSRRIVAIRTSLDWPYERHKADYLQTAYTDCDRYLGVPRPFDLIQTGMQLHLVMQYFKGRPLTEFKLTLVDRILRSSAPQKRLMTILFKVAIIANQIRSAGRIHGDLNLGNILYDADDNVMVIDIGGYSSDDLGEDVDADQRGFDIDMARYGIDVMEMTELADGISMPRLEALAKATKVGYGGVTFADLLRDEVFREERLEFGIADGDDPTSRECLLKVVELKGANRRHFDALPSYGLSDISTDCRDIIFDKGASLKQ